MTQRDPGNYDCDLETLPSAFLCFFFPFSVFIHWVQYQKFVFVKSALH